MMSVYFFTGIFFTLGFNAFLSQVADDFVTGGLSIVGGVISSVVWLGVRIDGNGNVPDDKGKGWLRLPLLGFIKFVRFIKWEGEVFSMMKTFALFVESFQYDENFSYFWGEF